MKNDIPPIALLCLFFVIGSSAFVVSPSGVLANRRSSPHIREDKLSPGKKWPTYKLGESDKACVMATQFLLRARGFYKPRHGAMDGIFGRSTEQAVREFQSSRGLRVDGIVGGQTLTALVPRLSPGSRGDGVRALQTLYNANIEGYESPKFIAVDGIYAAATTAALRRISIARVLTLDQWCELFNYGCPQPGDCGNG